MATSQSGRPYESWWGTDYTGTYYPENWRVYDMAIQRQLHQQDWLDYLSETSDMVDWGNHSPFGQPWSQGTLDDFLSAYADRAGIQYAPGGQSGLGFNGYNYGDPGIEHWFASNFGANNLNRDDYRRFMEFLVGEGLAEFDPSQVRGGGYAELPYRLNDRGLLDLLGTYTDANGVTYNINNFSPDKQAAARRAGEGVVGLAERQQQYDRNKQAGIGMKSGRPTGPTPARGRTGTMMMGGY